MGSNIKVIGNGYCLDGNVIANDAFTEFLETSDEWIVQRTGIKKRVMSQESAATLGARALEKALESANITADELDLILVATYATEDVMPNTASKIKKILDIQTEAPTFDVNVACSGFVYILELARAMSLAQNYRNIAVIGTERQSQYLDFTDRSTSILFGDGAGAMILGQSETKKVYDAYLTNKIDKHDALILKHSEHETPFTKSREDVNSTNFLQMKGQDVFQFAVKTVRTALKEVLLKNAMLLEDIDYIVLHQANKRIIQFVASSLKIEESKFVMNVENVANTSSASIPIAFSQHVETVEKGKKYVLIGFGAGLSTGATIIEY